MKNFRILQCNSLTLMTLDLISSTLIIHHLSICVPLSNVQRRLAICLMNFVFDRQEILNFINHDNLLDDKDMNAEDIFSDFSQTMIANGVPGNFINQQNLKGHYFNFDFLQEIDANARITFHHSTDKAVLLAQFDD